jgi:adenosine kinase
MARAAEVDLSSLAGVEHVIVAPDAPGGMELHVKQSIALRAKLVFAPAQQLSSLSDATLIAGLNAAWLVVGNDYELEVIHRRTGRDVDSLAAGGALVARTLGGQGSELRIEGAVHTIPIAAAESVVDPTGAGDAYIAGLLSGLRAGRAADVAGRMAALAATYAVEQHGPQSHRYTRDEFAARYATAFGAALD